MAYYARIQSNQSAYVASGLGGYAPAAAYAPQPGAYAADGYRMQTAEEAAAAAGQVPMSSTYQAEKMQTPKKAAKRARNGTRVAVESAYVAPAYEHQLAGLEITAGN